jgi:hypothetical protein
MGATTILIKSTWKLKRRKKMTLWVILEVHLFNRDLLSLLLIRNRNMSGNGG